MFAHLRLRLGILGSLLLVLILLVSSVVLVAPRASAGCPSGPSGPSGGLLCGSYPVTVVVQIPIGAGGVSLAQVNFNGTLYANGSTLPPLSSGVNYTFSAVSINPGYSFDHWSVSNGTIGSLSSSTSTVMIGCISIPCPTVNLSITLDANDHSLVSGQVFEANAVYSMSASFTVPKLTWWNANHSSDSIPGAYEIVNWGVGLGGILSASTVVAGVQLNNTTTTSGYTVTRKPFWSTTFTTSGQTIVTLAGNPTVNAGDTISVQLGGASFGCTSGQVSLAITDLNTNGGYTGCVTAPVSPKTGQWMVWDPKSAMDKFAPGYTNHGWNFANLTFNGRLVTPTFRYPPGPCTPLPGCMVLYFTPVIYSQWIYAGAGWNESLDSAPYDFIFTAGHSTYIGLHFQPFVSTLANLRIAIDPINELNVSRSLGVWVNGSSNMLHQNGDVVPLAYGTSYTLGITGLYGGCFYLHGNCVQQVNDSFLRWATSSNGSLSNATNPRTTFAMGSPGLLESLTFLHVINWAGYVDGTDSRATSSAGGKFVIPSTSWNNTNWVNGGSPHLGEWFSIWVGLGGAGNRSLWQAGVQVTYNNSSSSVRLVPWWEYYSWNNMPNPVLNYSFVANPGDSILVNVSVSGGRDSWSITDLNNNQHWSGSISSTTYPVDLSSAEWVAEEPNSGFIPNFSPVAFTELLVNGRALHMLGSYQIDEGWTSEPNVFMSPSVVYSPQATGFNISETSYPGP